MKNNDRKNNMIQLLVESDSPVTGAELAGKFGVTRQVIVQDIAILRAEKYNIISTAKGYILQSVGENSIKRTITVRHSAEKIKEELQIIVDLGGRVLTTSVDHPAYGTLSESLNVKSRRDIGFFLDRIKESGCAPLLALTNGIHKHTIEADDEETIDEICKQLETKGFFIGI